MKCKICKAEAVVALRSHNAAFCPDCYKDFFARQVERGIEGQKLFTRDERVLVALSGGKDSLALMLELSRQGYNVTGLHIDLDIPVSSAAARGVVERFCAKHGLPFRRWSGGCLVAFLPEIILLDGASPMRDYTASEDEYVLFPPSWIRSFTRLRDLKRAIDRAEVTIPAFVVSGSVSNDRD